MMERRPIGNNRVSDHVPSNNVTASIRLMRSIMDGGMHVATTVFALPLTTLTSLKDWIEAQ